MTEGSVLRHLLVFAVPLLLGNLFQMLYNTVDAWVLGNFADSSAAFDAVGSVGPMVNMLIGFFSGLSIGAGVVISQYFGAGRYDKVRTTVHTTVSLTAILSVLFTVIGLLFIPVFLKFSNIPDHVAPYATQYLTIYFCGIAGLLFYNMGAGILRAVGDSTKPFLFLVVSSILHTVLDVLFVAVLRLGVFGVAISTVVTQALSALLVFICLMRTKSCVHFSFRWLCLDREHLKQIFAFGFPTALQAALTNFTNIFSQSYINAIEGGAAMGGWTAYSKIDQVLILPAQALAASTSTFLSQNIGKHQFARAKRGFAYSMLIVLSITVVLMIPILIFAPALVGFFNRDAIEYGTLFLRLISPFYLFYAVNQVCGNALIGTGHGKVNMFVSIGCFAVYRLIYLYVVSNFISNEAVPIALSYPTGWVIAAVISMVYFCCKGLKKAKVVE